MNQPGLRERKKQRTRWAIQEHALRLFARQGFDATTVEQIAEAAEISPSTFFRYFPTKEDVVVEDRYDDLIVAAIESAPAGLSPLDTLRHALVGSMGEVGPAERKQIILRMRLIYSVPALRSRSLGNLMSSTDNFAPPLARRLGRDPDDFAVRVFVSACMASTGLAVLAWADGDGTGDLAALTGRALDAVAELVTISST